MPKLGLGGPTLTQILRIPLPLAYPRIPCCNVSSKPMCTVSKPGWHLGRCPVGPSVSPSILYPMPTTSLVTARLSMTVVDLCCDVVLCMIVRQAFRPDTLPELRTRNPARHSFARSRWCVRGLLSRLSQCGVFASCPSRVYDISLGPRFCGCLV